MYDENINLVPFDGPTTLVSTNQAVWRLPSAQGRLVHLKDVDKFEQEICLMFPPKGGTNWHMAGFDQKFVPLASANTIQTS